MPNGSFDNKKIKNEMHMFQTVLLKNKIALISFLVYLIIFSVQQVLFFDSESYQREIGHFISQICW